MKKQIFTALIIIGSLMTVEASDKNNILDNSILIKDTLSINSDTNRIHWGKHEVLLLDGGNEIHFIRNRFSDDEGYYKPSLFQKFNSRWSGLGFGVTGLGSGVLSTNIDSTDSYMEVNVARSFAFDFYIEDWALPIVNNRLALVSGVGFSWDFYNLSDKTVLLKKGKNQLEHQFDTVEYSKNKLCACNFVVPLVLEWHPLLTDGLFVIAGVEGNLHLGSKTKQKTNDGKKTKNHSDLYMNTFSCNATVRVGYDDFALYFSSAITPMFKSGKGPDIYPFSAGFVLTF